MDYQTFPPEEKITLLIPFETILTHLVIDLTLDELAETGELTLLKQYRDSAIETAMDYQNEGFSLESKKTVQAILLMIASMWRNREDNPEGKIGEREKNAAFRLLDFRREGIL